MVKHGSFIGESINGNIYLSGTFKKKNFIQTLEKKGNMKHYSKKCLESFQINERKSEQAHIPHAPTLLENAVYNE